MLVVTDLMRHNILTECVKHAHLLHLFTNDIDIDSKMEFSDFCSPNCKSYAPCELINDWKIKSTEAKGRKRKFLIFDCDVYGYFITNRDGQVLWAERFPEPFGSLQCSTSYGFKVEIIPKFGLE